MKDLIVISRALLAGKSVTRAYLDLRLSTEVLRGSVIDIGGGKNADYLSFMKRDDGVVFKTFDIKAGDKNIDFETDSLPSQDSAYDTVLFLNVMEHIFNYQHIANEIVRITKPGGRLIGFVPFLMWYHPDHSDYFRYTDEAIKKIFFKAGVNTVEVHSIGAGPFVAAAHMILSHVPSFIRPVLFLFFVTLDKLYVYFGKKNHITHQLGYFFIVNK